MNRCCFVICWFGKLPNYFNIWLKTCERNCDFDFLIFSDMSIECKLPENVIINKMLFNDFIKRAQKLSCKKISVNRPYRVCDFRPMYGTLFLNELAGYEFWGYCDVDVVFGQLNKYITKQMLDEQDAIFNGGHLSLLRNTAQINQLYSQKGSLFDYETVITHDAIFAFDEITGIQSIAKEKGIKAVYLIPYIETEIRYKQLRSRLDKINPNYQAFFWEQGNLFRIKIEEGKVFFKEYAYMHLQKRTLFVDNSRGEIENSFWITPNGFVKKDENSILFFDKINQVNPYEGEMELKKQNLIYKIKKIKSILSRNPYQIYVRLMQEKSGINRNQGTLEEEKWEMF